MTTPARSGKCNGCGWRLSTGVAAIGALAMSVGAVARPVGASVLTRSSVTETVGSQIRSGVITILSDQEKLRGSVSGVAGVEATVYANVIDTANWTLSQQRFNYAAQSSNGVTNDLGFSLPIGTFIADDMTLSGGGWQLGDQISSFSAFVRRSGGDDTRLIGDGTARATVTLWDGDPMNAEDTTGAGFTAAPIPGATCDFTLDPAFGFGTLQNLKCILATPITPPHDTVWMVLTSDSCRLFWSITLLKATLGSSRDLGQIGQDDDAGAIGSFGFVTAATDGNCCAGGATCGPTGAAIDCDGGLTNASGRCSDGDAETHLSFNFGGPCTGNAATDSCVNYLAQINAPASTTISLVPVGGAGNIGITGNEITYTAGGGTVSLEVRVSSWDPNGTGTLLKAWQAAVDVSGYTSALQGTLTPSSKSCTVFTDCLPGGSSGADFLGVCGVSGNSCSVDGDCAFNGIIPGDDCVGLKCDLRFAADPAGSEVCLPGYIQTKRSDYVFNGLLEALAIDLSNPSGGFGWASALNGSPSIAPPSPFPAEGLYVASLQLDISSNAKGTFTMGLLPPSDSVLIDDNSLFIPLIGIVPVRITIQLGQCCDLTAGQPFTCVSDTDTVAECAVRNAAFLFAAGASCDPNNPNQGCVDCGFDVNCDDGDPCTQELCDQDPASPTVGLCSNPINYDPATQCCNSTSGVTVTTDDGDPCTVDSCDGAGGGAGNGNTVNSPTAPVGTVCGNAAADDCDAQDTCDGAGLCVDRKQPFGTLCGGLQPFCMFTACDGLGLCGFPQDVNGQPCATDQDCIDLNNHSDPGCDPVTLTCRCPRLRPCCLPDGSCLEVSTFACASSGGTSVTACLGDGNGNGSDDTCDGLIPADSDCWETQCGRTRVSLRDDPIPADFFEPGSLPFDGIILLGGGAPGAPDTRIKRLADMVLTDIGQVASTPIELVSLNLVSCNPIEVMTGGAPALWNVQVGLSTVPVTAPIGDMTVTKTHANGGTFTALLPVKVRFTFTQVTDPGQVRVLDTGQAGQPPETLQTLGSAPWVHRLKGGTTASFCGVNFVPGIEEDPVTETQCCKKVGHAGPGHIHETAPPDCSGCPTVTGACCDAGTGACTVVEGEPNCSGEYKGDGTDCDDTDGDGLADVQENNFCGGPSGDRCNTPTSPLLADTDGDGCLDGAEVAAGTDPCDPCLPAGGCVGTVDCDGNGIADACELPGNDCDNDGELDRCQGALSGACCNNTPGCAELTKTACDALAVQFPQRGWVFQGTCTKCPTQNVGTAMHDGVAVVHFPSPVPECSITGPIASAAVEDCSLRQCLFDTWITDPNEPTCHNFDGTGVAPAIPAGFFGIGSDPFVGQVCFGGVPLGPTPFGNFGDADTIICRSADPFGRCDLASVTSSTVSIQIVALSLMSSQPIVVTFNGGQSAELWNVAVGLSNVPSPLGTLTAVKTHCNGGTFSSILPVQPKFTFTNVNNPTTTLQLDTGTVGDWPVFTLVQAAVPPAQDAPWIHDPQAALRVVLDPCTTFHPGIEDPIRTSACDCNGNGFRDQCDIENGIADCNANGVPDSCEVPAPGGSCTVNCVADCNANGVPDVCEPDCNGNGVADACDIANCPVSDPSCRDCNGNGVPDGCEPDCNGNGIPDGCDLVSIASMDCNINGRPDECDIASGASLDCNANGVPDSCELVGGVPTAAVAEQILNGAGATVASVKNRFLSFSGGDVGFLQAVRVTFVSLPGAFSVFDGTSLWVDLPTAASELPGKKLTDPIGTEPTFLAAALSPTPVFADWNAFGVVHVYDERIIPSRKTPIDPLEPAIYEIQFVNLGCNLNQAASFSVPLSVTNARWTDVAQLVSGQFRAPDGIVAVDDTLALLAKFGEDLGAPIKPRAELLGVDLNGPVPAVDGAISVSDLLAVLDAFGGDSYPFAPPAP